MLIGVLVVGAVACIVAQPAMVQLLWRTATTGGRSVPVGRWHVLYLWFGWPWLLLADFATGFGRGLGELPLVGFAWRVRPVVTVIAIVQSIQAERFVAAVGVAVVIGLTYLLPWTLQVESPAMDRVRSSVADSPAPSPAPRLEAPRPPQDHNTRGRRNAAHRGVHVAPMVRCTSGLGLGRGSYAAELEAGWSRSPLRAGWWHRGCLTA